MRELSVKTLMLADVKTADGGLSLREARQRFPLGSQKQIVAVDAQSRYAGLVMLDDLGSGNFVDFAAYGLPR